MKQFSIEDDVVGLVRELGRPQEWESFSEVLRRVLTDLKRQKVRTGEARRTRPIDEIVAELSAMPAELADKIINGYRDRQRVRAPTPDVQSWLSRVPELGSIAGLNTWRAVCDHLVVEVGQDSARRRLQDWVRRNKPQWPPVPDAREIDAKRMPLELPSPPKAWKPEPPQVFAED